MKKQLLILLCLPMIGFGQNVNIPDANFKAYLVGEPSINTNSDSEIQVSEATSFNGAIDCSNMSINDLTGIEAFTALTQLYCYNNNMTNILLNNNTALERIYICDNSLLNHLEINNIIQLEALFIYNNQITHLYLNNITMAAIYNTQPNSNNMLFPNPFEIINITNCTFVNFNNLYNNLIDISGHSATLELILDNVVGLKTLDVSNNQMTCLNISNCPDLEDLNCSSNLLEQLNTRNGNFNNMYVNALNNNLTCVEVDNIGTATNDWDFDSFATLTTNCNYTNSCNYSTSIQEHTTNKEILKITDILGRETKKTNQPLLYLYDDGTVEKRIVIE